MSNFGFGLWEAAQQPESAEIPDEVVLAPGDPEVYPAPTGDVREVVAFQLEVTTTGRDHAKLEKRIRREMELMFGANAALWRVAVHHHRDQPTPPSRANQRGW